MYFILPVCFLGIVFMAIKRMRSGTCTEPVQQRRVSNSPNLSESKESKFNADNEIITVSSGIRIEYENISLTINSSGTRKRILDSIDGIIESGNLYALIGASGKSVLR